jgi:hypothetical protein
MYKISKFNPEILETTRLSGKSISILIIGEDLLGVQPLLQI